ncbi:MAG: response regulator, partial [Deltaproteobacteria bacterium]|nr:response regulator [Deltaproteobacteria bacterium]
TALHPPAHIHQYALADAPCIRTKIRRNLAHLFFAEALKLPDIEGGELYPLIMNVRPKLKVVVCSGFTIEGPAQDILDAGAQAFIQKPFSFAELAETLKEVLEGR